MQRGDIRRSLLFILWSLSVFKKHLSKNVTYTRVMKEYRTCSRMLDTSEVFPLPTLPQTPSKFPWSIKKIKFMNHHSRLSLRKPVNVIPQLCWIIIDMVIVRRCLFLIYEQSIQRPCFAVVRSYRIHYKFWRQVVNNFAIKFSNTVNTPSGQEDRDLCGFSATWQAVNF